MPRPSSADRTTGISRRRAVITGTALGAGVPHVAAPA
ncbi:hypothetical protein Saa2_02037 [Streptomyces acidiscabies]|nr:hypothetical protein Saa2_02037 [Streptomyces acidiscabies]